MSRLMKKILYATMKLMEKSLHTPRKRKHIAPNFHTSQHAENTALSSVTQQDMKPRNSSRTHYLLNSALALAPLASAPTQRSPTQWEWNEKTAQEYMEKLNQLFEADPQSSMTFDPKSGEITATILGKKNRADYVHFQIQHHGFKVKNQQVFNHGQNTTWHITLSAPTEQAFKKIMSLTEESLKNPVYPASVQKKKDAKWKWNKKLATQYMKKLSQLFEADPRTRMEFDSKSGAIQATIHCQKDVSNNTYVYLQRNGFKVQNSNPVDYGNNSRWHCTIPVPTKELFDKIMSLQPLSKPSITASQQHPAPAPAFKG